MSRGIPPTQSRHSGSSAWKAAEEAAAIDGARGGIAMALLEGAATGGGMSAELLGAAAFTPPLAAELIAVALDGGLSSSARTLVFLRCLVETT